jgi:drug/metabolite transporter (DMT)-like permease
MSKKKLTLSILLFLIFSDALETLTQYFFKKGAIIGEGFAVTSAADFFGFLRLVFSSGYIWLGLLSVALTFVVWSGILSKIDLSVAVPVASFSYVFVPIVSIVFLHEKVNMLRWCGIFFILVGVVFVSLSSKEKEGVVL